MANIQEYSRMFENVRECSMMLWFWNIPGKCLRSFYNFNCSHFINNEGDLVMLSTNHLRNLDKTPKLSSKYIGPFKIIKRISDVVYELELPTDMNIHPSFHISKLKKYNKNDDKLFPNR